MVRRWIRHELPVMVCVDVDEATEHAQITEVVPGDIGLARDHAGHLLVYNERVCQLGLSRDDAVRVWRGRGPSSLAMRCTASTVHSGPA